MRPCSGMPPDLAHLYDQHAPALFAFVLNFTRSEAETRDVLQELFLKLSTQPAQLDGVRDPAFNDAIVARLPQHPKAALLLLPRDPRYVDLALPLLHATDSRVVTPSVSTSASLFGMKAKFAPHSRNWPPAMS